MTLLTSLLISTAALACPPESQVVPTDLRQNPALFSVPVALAAMVQTPLADETASPLIAPAPTPPLLPEFTPDSQRVIDLVICLDTSGSMSGLIDAAKTKLWEVVNDLALAKPTPKLRVALLTFGNDGHNAENGWVNIDAHFTDDLDLISQKLFAMTTNGGTELVARVMNAAGTQLDWSPGEDALKIMVVAGNESADQDQQISFRDVCKAAIARGIMVNSIYCGDINDGIAPGWREVATLADGHFAAIDHNHGTVVIATPYDDELARLSASINETYLPFGVEGQRAAMNQEQQDANAAGVSTAVAAQRCQTKAGQMYYNGSWDLVDASKQAEFDLEQIKDDELPEAMRGKALDEKRAMIAEMAQKRADIQKQVADISAKRAEFVSVEMKKQDEGDDKSFDAAIRNAIRDQAASKGFKFDEGC
jgi:Mg-chelatase subunit ChlD